MGSSCIRHVRQCKKNIYDVSDNEVDFDSRMPTRRTLKGLELDRSILSIDGEISPLPRTEFQSNHLSERDSILPSPYTDEIIDRLQIRILGEIMKIDTSLRFEGSKSYKDGIYTGQLEGDIRYGVGIFTFFTGEVYHGYWENGLPNKTGKLCIRGPEEYYEGEFVNGKFHGYGKYKNGDMSYEGNWSHNLKDGRGTEICGINTYRGLFREGRKHGDGVLKIEGVGKFKGTFENNQVSKGKFLKEEYYIEGNWENEQLVGEFQIGSSTGIIFSARAEDLEDINLSYFSGDFEIKELILNADSQLVVMGKFLTGRRN